MPPDGTSPWVEAERKKAGVHSRRNGTNGSEPTVVVRVARIVELASVRPAAISWLWPGYIPFGTLTSIAGDPGLGKGLMTTDLAARATTGKPWPGSDVSRDPINVLWLCAEDDLANTVRPRLEAAGGDVRRVAVIESVREEIVGPGGKSGGGREKTFRLDADLPLLDEAIAKKEARLVIVDPTSAYLGAADSHVDAEVRAILSPLNGLAAKYAAAILGVHHLNKGVGRQAQYRVSGSIAFVAAPRASYLVAADQEDPNDRRRFFLPIKQNLAPKPPGLSFKTGGRIMDYEDGVRVDVGLIGWEEGTVERSAYDALAEEGAQMGEAAQFLRELLADGPKSPDEVYREGRGAGFGQRTLERAKKSAGIRSRKLRRDENLSQPWVWELASGLSNENNTSQDAPGGLGHLGRLGEIRAWEQAGSLGGLGPESGGLGPESGGLGMYRDGYQDRQQTTKTANQNDQDRQGRSVASRHENDQGDQGDQDRQHTRVREDQKLCGCGRPGVAQFRGGWWCSTHYEMAVKAEDWGGE